MASVTVRIPDSIRKNGFITSPLPASAKSRLAGILTRKDLVCPPAPISEVSSHANFWLNAVDEKKLKDLGEPSGFSVGETISALLVAESLAWSAPTSGLPVAPEVACNPDLARVLKALGKDVRIEQSRFFNSLEKVTAIADPQKLPKVLFAEAGTGVGKTLAYLSSAHAFLKRNNMAQVAVAVPSHALMDQVLQEWRSITTALGEPVATATLIGQNEFVSEQALSEVHFQMDDCSAKDEISAWAKAGAPCSPQSVIRHAWTMAGLRHASPTFALAAEVRLGQRETDEDLGYASYKAQWDALPGSSFIFLSHAMLASLVKRRVIAQARDLKDSTQIKEATAQWIAVPGDLRERRLFEILNEIYADADTEIGLDLLPNLDLLIVDEAHSLEDAFNLVLSQDVSLWSLERELKLLHEAHPRLISAKSVQEMEGIRARLQRSPAANSDKVVVLHEDDKRMLADMDSLLQGVTKITGPKKNKLATNPGFRRIVQIARSIHLALIAGDQYGGSIGAMIDWSPDRKWPRLQVGRMSVAREMNYLWIAVAQRSILVSGTLYEEHPQLSAETSRRSLSVPVANMVTMEPVHAAWQYSPVTACVISETCAVDGRVRFLRPKLTQNASAAEIVQYESAYQAWVYEVARYIFDAHKLSSGGMLVLGTAYKDIADIAKAIDAQLGSPILVQTKGIPLASMRAAFLAASQAGQRAVLFAVGGAWTGFDLHSPTNPNALTDLVILNAPFGAISRSLARQNRALRPGGIFEIVGLMLVLVRQGVGRLVRSPDTPNNRRIHWLDARIHGGGASAGLFNPVKRFLTKYKGISVS